MTIKNNDNFDVRYLARSVIKNSTPIGFIYWV